MPCGRYVFRMVYDIHVPCGAGCCSSSAPSGASGSDGRKEGEAGACVHISPLPVAPSCRGPAILLRVPAPPPPPRARRGGVEAAGGALFGCLGARSGYAI
eukprot:1232982-Pyramimonas_sp.AAC.1